MNVAINSLNKTSVKKQLSPLSHRRKTGFQFRLVIIENTIPNLLVTTIMPDPQFVDFKKVLRSHIKLGNAYQPRQIARMILQRLYNRRKDLIYPTFSFSSSPPQHLSGVEEKVPIQQVSIFCLGDGSTVTERGLYHPRKREPQEFLTELAEDVRDRFNSD